MLSHMERDIQKSIEEMGPWYQSIDLGSGLKTPGKGADIRSKFQPMVSFLPEDLEGKKVLDVGCNAGGLLFEFAKRGAECTGVEISQHYIAQANLCAEFGSQRFLQFQAW